MVKQCLASFLLLLTPTALLCQRYGRPYTLAESPQLLLQVKVQNESHYFRVSDLRKMQRLSVTLMDPETRASHVYEGVALEQLAPGSALGSRWGVIEIEFGLHQTTIVSASDLNPQTKLIVVDTVDGKTLAGHAPYYFVEEGSGKPLRKIVDVECITIRSVDKGSHS
jgi:hypothetical protein